MKCDEIQRRLGDWIGSAGYDIGNTVGDFSNTIDFAKQDIYSRLNDLELPEGTTCSDLEAAKDSVGKKIQELERCVSLEIDGAYNLLNQLKRLKGTAGRICNDCCATSPDDLVGCVDGKIEEVEADASNILDKIDAYLQRLNDSSCFGLIPGIEESLSEAESVFNMCVA